MFPCFGCSLNTGLMIMGTIDTLWSILGLGGWLFAQQFGFFHKGNKLEMFEIDEEFQPTTVKTDSNGLIPDVSTEFNAYTYSQYDDVEFTKYENKISQVFEHRHDVIAKLCGVDYFEDHLDRAELTITENLFDQIASYGMLAEGLYLIMGLGIASIACIFERYLTAKLTIISIWLLQFIPITLYIYIMIMIQSRRLCILEHALPHFRIQSFVLVMVIFKTCVYKVYELFLLACYIEVQLKKGPLFADHIATLRSDRLERPPAYQRRYIQERRKIDSAYPPETTKIQRGRRVSNFDPEAHVQFEFDKSIAHPQASVTASKLSW